MARLLFLTGTLPDVRAGSGTFVGISVLAAALRAAGHEVTLLAPKSGPASQSLPGRLAFNVGVRGPARRLARNADAIVEFDLDGVLVGRTGARRVASVKGELAEEARFERGLARIRLTLESVLEGIHVRSADRVVATSAHSKRRIHADYGVSLDRIFVVPEPIDLPRWDRALAAAPSDNGDPSVVRVLCVAHLYPRKDVASLLDAMARLPAGPVLRVVGTGPEEERLKARAGALGLSGRVEFLGHVQFDRLAAEYRRADVFCLPSRQEGFGIVFLEAMAAGIPIVAARAAAVPEVVVDGVCGDLVEPGDAAGLASALGRLSTDGERRRALGNAGRLRAAAYDAPIVAAAFLRAIGFDPSAV